MWSWWSHNLATAGFFSRKDEGLSAGVSACWRRGWCILYGNTLFDAQTMNCISGRKKKPGCLLQTSGLLSPIPTSTSVPDGVQDVVSGTSTPSLQILISRWCSACRSSSSVPSLHSSTNYLLPSMLCTTPTPPGTHSPLSLGGSSPIIPS